MHQRGPATGFNPEPTADPRIKDLLERMMTNAHIDERRIHCPFCAESMTVLVDASAGGQSYIEDCQVCCQPMQISFAVDDGEVLDLRVDCAS